VILILLYLRIKDPFSFSRVMSQLTSFKHGKGGGSRRHTRDDILLGYKFYRFPKRLSNAKNSMAPTISRRYRNQIFSRHNATKSKSCTPKAKPSQAKPSNVPFTNKPAECILVPINSDIIQFQLFSFLNFTMNPNSSIFF